MGERSYLSIGDVLSLLREEFPDITISKIRFLESRGLLVPERTPSGYRKFYDHDVERLRWILRQQREHFLPLKVIKGRLEGAEAAQQPESLFDPAERPPAFGDEEAARPLVRLGQNGSHPSLGSRLEEVASGEGRVATMRREDEEEKELAAVHQLAKGSEGQEPPCPAPPPAGRAGSAASRPPAPPRPTSRRQGGQATVATGSLGASLTAPELAQACGLSVAQVEQLESFGLIAGRDVAGVHCYDEQSSEVAKVAAGFAAYGIEPRHLRIFMHAAERQAGLYSQVVTPLLRQRNPEARARAESDLARMAELGTALMAAFVRDSLRDLTGR